MPYITVCYKYTEDTIKAIIEDFKSYPTSHPFYFKGKVRKYRKYLRQEYIFHKSYIIDKIPEDFEDFRLPIKEGRYNTRLVEVDCFGNLLQTLKVYNNIKVNN